MLKKHYIWCLILTLLLAPSKTFAGLFIPGSGGAVLGRGGTFCAKADTLSCLWYNPAGLSKLEGFQVSLNLFQDFLLQSFERDEVPEILNILNDSDPDFQTDYFNRSESEIQIFPLPYFALSYNFSSIDLTVAFSPFFAPNIPDNFRYFPDKKASRYVTLNQNINLFIPQVALGWQPFSWLRIGGTMEFGIATGFMEMIVNAAFPPQTPSNTGLLSDPTNVMIDVNGELSYTQDQLRQFIIDRERKKADITVQAHADDPQFFFWGSIGAIFAILDLVEIGISFRPGVSFAMNAKLDSPSLDNQTEFFDPNVGYNTHSPWHTMMKDNPVFGGILFDENGNPVPLIDGFEGADRDDAIGLVLKLPPILRFGIRFIIEGYGDIEFDFTWEGNGLMGPNEYQANFAIAVNEEIAPFAEAMGFSDIPVDNVTFNETIRDNWFFGLGTDWEILEEELIVRTGVFYETGMQKEEQITVLFDVWRVGWTAGFTYIYDGWLRLDLAYGFMVFPDVKVSDTTLSTMNIPTQLVIDKIENQLNNPNYPGYIDPDNTELRSPKEEELAFYYDNLLNHVQDGWYKRFDHLVSLGISVMFDW